MTTACDHSHDHSASPDLSPVEAAKQSAREAGLRYVSDKRPGISRKALEKGFEFLTPSGDTITDEEVLQRIRKLAIPPAWTDVWIAPAANVHLQATGRDARQRKQYRYHADFRSVRDEHKFHRMLDFAKALPKIRRRVERDLLKKESSRERVLAGVVKLLETTLIRVGNDEYAQTNKSYGLTTMLNRHAKIHGSEIQFVFKGKSGVHHSIEIRDRKLANLVKQCQELPGQELFAWKDADGKIHDVGSGDVNDYLHEIVGEEFTAKDFRTWAATVLAALALRESAVFASNQEAKRNIVAAIESVSKLLGNTPSICRKCYIHPIILDSYMEGLTIATLQQNATQALEKLHQLPPEEAAVVTLLQQRLQSGPAASGKVVKVKNLSSPAALREQPMPASRNGVKGRRHE